MAEDSYPIAGGGTVNDFRYEQLFAEVLGSGLVGDATASATMYGDATGRHVKLARNRAAIVRAFRWFTDSDGLTKPLEPNTSGLPRLDLGVLRLDRADWTVRFAVKTGAPATTPVAPVLTQQPGPNGVWEIPVGTVRVVSTSAADAAAGLPSITPADVTPLDYFLAPPAVVCHSTRMPLARPGQIVTQYDKGRVFAPIGSTLQLIGEDGPWTRITPAAGWDPSNIFVHRRNGWTWLQALVYRNSKTTLAAQSDAVVAYLPAEFRPRYGDIYVGGAHDTKFARFHVQKSTGRILFQGSDMPLANDQFIWIHPVTWASA